MLGRERHNKETLHTILTIIYFLIHSVVFLQPESQALGLGALARAAKTNNHLAGLGWMFQLL